MKLLRSLICFAALLALSAAVRTGLDHHDKNAPGRSGDGAASDQRRRDCARHAGPGYATGTWYSLTSDSTGSYINGTWKTLTTMPSGYSPLYYASAVLADGKVVTIGGEYNNNAEEETNLGAIYNPQTNKWTSITPPIGWTHIGDAASVVLPNGTLMIGNCGYAGSECTNQTYQAQLNESTLTWTIIGAGNGKADQNSEEGWELLPTGNVLTVDLSDLKNSELFNPSTDKWSSAGNTGVTLPNSSCYEIGPAVLRPDGTVYAVGGTANTALYTVSTSTWAAGGRSEQPGFDGRPRRDSARWKRAVPRRTAVTVLREWNEVVRIQRIEFDVSSCSARLDQQSDLYRPHVGFCLRTGPVHLWHQRRPGLHAGRAAYESTWRPVL